MIYVILHGILSRQELMLRNHPLLMRLQMVVGMRLP